MITRLAHAGPFERWITAKAAASSTPSKSKNTKSQRSGITWPLSICPRRQAYRTVMAMLGLVAVTGLAGCGERLPKPALMSAAVVEETIPSPLAGEWWGEVWEAPSANHHGYRRIALEVADDGSWIVSTGDGQRASGRSEARGDYVVSQGGRGS